MVRHCCSIKSWTSFRFLINLSLFITKLAIFSKLLPLFGSFFVFHSIFCFSRNTSHGDSRFHQFIQLPNFYMFTIESPSISVFSFEKNWTLGLDWIFDSLCSWFHGNYFWWITWLIYWRFMFFILYVLVMQIWWKYNWINTGRNTMIICRWFDDVLARFLFRR